MTRHDLDARGLVLPLALVRLKQTLDRAEGGEEVSFLCDAEGAPEAIQRFLDRTGHELISRASDDAEPTYIIRK